MPFYYVQDVCQKNQLPTRLDERRAERLSKKESLASVNRALGSGGTLSRSAGNLRTKN